MQASEKNGSNGMVTKSRVSSDTESIRKGKHLVKECLLARVLNTALGTEFVEHGDTG